MPFNATASVSVAGGDSIESFVNNAISDDLLTVPGIGPKAVKGLEKSGVETTTQLIGVLLSMKKADFTMRQHIDSFNDWLLANGVPHGHVHRVVTAIGRKVSEKFLIPGFFDVASLAAEEEVVIEDTAAAEE